MTAPDPFEQVAAAYVFGALGSSERGEFEAHLATCAACSATVAECRELTGLLAGIDEQEIVTVPPETLLPGLLRRAAHERRRQRWLIGGLASVAAACVLTLAVLLWPTSTAVHSHTESLAMTPVVDSPVTATVELTQTSSGTAITLHCAYSARSTEGAVRYALVVYDRKNEAQQLSSWTLKPGQDMTFPATTALAENQISRLDVTYQSTAILTAAP
jgi:anti-sigma-K factor RskA